MSPLAHLLVLSKPHLLSVRRSYHGPDPNPNIFPTPRLIKPQPPKGLSLLEPLPYPRSPRPPPKPTRWEDEKDESEREESKCLQPDPRFCGRSPLGVRREDVAGILENTTALFARKFEGPHGREAMDEIDRHLARQTQSSTFLSGKLMSRQALWKSLLW